MQDSPPPEPTPPPPSPKALAPPVQALPPTLPARGQLQGTDRPMTTVTPPVAARTQIPPPVAPAPSPAFNQPALQPYPNVQQRRSIITLPSYVTPPAATVTSTPPPYYSMPRPMMAYNPNAPRPIEVFHLSDSANTSIPASIREKFQHDNQGHVLFFSTPPLNTMTTTPGEEAEKLSHSTRYMEVREERRRLVEERKRKKHDEQYLEEQNAKRARADEAASLAPRLGALTSRAVEALTREILYL